MIRFKTKILRTMPFFVVICMSVSGIIAFAQEASSPEQNDARETVEPAVIETVPSQTDAQAGNDTTIARRLFKQERFDEAIQTCRLLLEADPSNTDAEILLYKAEAAKAKEALRIQQIKEHALRKKALVNVEEKSMIGDPPATVDRRFREDLIIKIKPDVPEKEIALIQEKMNQRVSVDLIDADLSYILTLLFRSCGINIIANEEDLQGHKLTIHVQEFPLEEILKYIARNEGITYTLTPEAVWITTPSKPMFETKAVFLKKGLTDVSEAAESDSSDLEELMLNITGGGGQPALIEWPDGSAYYLDRKENIVYIKSTPEAVSQAIRLIETLDVTPAQVLIESRFVEVGSEDLFDLGIDWNFASPYVITNKGGEPATQIEAGSGTSFSVPRVSDAVYPGGLGLKYIGVLTDPQFQSVLHALDDKEDTNTLSAPKLIALNNYTATIEVKQKIVYVKDYDISYPSTTVVTGDNDVSGQDSRPTIVPQIGEEDVGITLKITPSLGADRETVTLTIEPVITEKVDEEIFDYTYPGPTGEESETKQFTVPIISTRTLLTKLAVKDGSTIVIGGLMKDDEIMRTRRVPGLSRIPILGRLFRRDERDVVKRNLMIFVTARVLDPSGGEYISKGPSFEENSARYSTVIRKSPGIEVVEESSNRRERGE